jgi:hypothetical protein
LIEVNSGSIVKVNNEAYEAFKLALWELPSGAIIAPNFLDVE